jgi:hypothetical protein
MQGRRGPRYISGSLRWANPFLPKPTLREAGAGEKIAYVHREIDPGVSQFLSEQPLHETSPALNMRARLEAIPKEQTAFSLEADGVCFFRCRAIKRSFEDDGVVMMVVALARR